MRFTKTYSVFERSRAASLASARAVMGMDVSDQAGAAGELASMIEVSAVERKVLWSELVPTWCIGRNSYKIGANSTIG